MATYIDELDNISSNLDQVDFGNVSFPSMF